jgi:hypothetical protein
VSEEIGLRFVDVALAFPIIVLALVVAMLGRNLLFDIDLIVAIAIPIMPKVARVVRSAALAIREMPYPDRRRGSRRRSRRQCAARPSREPASSTLSTAILSGSAGVCPHPLRLSGGDGGDRANSGSLPVKAGRAIVPVNDGARER